MTPWPVLRSFQADHVEVESAAHYVLSFIFVTFSPPASLSFLGVLMKIYPTLLAFKVGKITAHIAFSSLIIANSYVVTVMNNTQATITVYVLLIAGFCNCVYNCSQKCTLLIILFFYIRFKDCETVHLNKPADKVKKSL